MTQLSDLNETELKALHERVREEYAAFQKRGLSLNMARGKPSP